MENSDLILHNEQDSASIPENLVLEGELVESEVTVLLEDIKSTRPKDDYLGLFNIFRIGNQVKDIVSPNKEYIVKFPAELLKKMRENNVDFLRDKLTDELLPVLYDYTEKGIAGQIRLELKDYVTPQQWENLGNSLNQSIDQIRLNNLANQLELVYQSVQRIQEGQDSDRFAEVLTGIELLDDAKNSKVEGNRLSYTHEAISKLKSGTNKVKLALLSELEKLPDIEDSFFSRFWFTLKDPENRPELHNTYNRVQTYFANYYKGLLPLVEAYHMIGESHRVDALLESASEVLHHKNLYRLNRFEKLLPVGYDYSVNWYKAPLKIEQRIRDAYFQEIETSDVLKITGQEILLLLDEEIGQ
ncbi:hypothetical protein HO984_00195 [Streptococcus suis]|nr:hypothetical protein [Streptococcus suis]HEM5420897.1 hypothetical protein [Streptococcus suis]